MTTYVVGEDTTCDACYEPLHGTGLMRFTGEELEGLPVIVFLHWRTECMEKRPVVDLEKALEHRERAKANGFGAATADCPERPL